MCSGALFSDKKARHSSPRQTIEFCLLLFILRNDMYFQTERNLKMKVSEKDKQQLKCLMVKKKWVFSVSLCLFDYLRNHDEIQSL